MAKKIHPDQQLITSTIFDNQVFSSCSNDYVTSNRETFTVWLKSLIFHGNGCTVFNSKGEIVFRVDNYQHKTSNEVFLMDLDGRVLFSVQKQKISVFGRWNGYKWNNCSKANKETAPWIRVRRNWRVFGGGGNSLCRVSMESAGGICRYRLIGSERGSQFKIVDNSGRIVAEAKEKRSSKGVCYGEDVLSLVIESHTDQLLILALMTVHGLIHGKL